MLKADFIGSNLDIIRRSPILDSEQLSNLKFLGISKAGNLSWSGSLGGIKVKIYRAFSPGQANFIEQISAFEGLAGFFPKVIFRKEEYLVVEWVLGKTLEELNWTSNSKWVYQIASLQSLLHNFHCSNDSTTLDYSTYLTERLLKYLGPFELTPSLQIMLDIVKTHPTDKKAHLCHFDMTPSNIVVDPISGHLKLIDNELLAQCWYYPMDFFNTYRSLQKSDAMQRLYIHSYIDVCDNLDLVIENKRYFQAVWGLRVVGAMLQSGEFNRGLEMADELLNFEHPLYTTLEKGRR
jgi:serine/threonine protein kinase